jgi:transposase InsO family protein
MKEHHPTINLVTLCAWFGISRQAYYQHEWAVSGESFQYALLLEKVKEVRKRHPRMGVRKLQQILRPFMEEHEIKMGRDVMFDFLSFHNMLICSRKHHVKTTHSDHWLKKYPNLIADFTCTRPNELWVSDITYLKIGVQPVYLSLITDAYSRKIVGYHLSENLHAEQTVKALKMALSGIEKRSEASEQLIHHSDRGVQYCSSSYVKCLKKSHIRISMTQNGDPLENAIAERINGIIKDEYLHNYPCKDIQTARKQLSIAVSLYNKERPHSSIGNLAPELVYSQYNLIKKEKIKRLWKNYYKKKCTFTNRMQD